MELHVLAVSFGLCVGAAKGERNGTMGRHERNGMKEALLRGLPRLGLTMNGMERKVAERSAPLECKGVKRKHLPQALAVKQYMPCTLDGWWGFLWCFFLATMLIEMGMLNVAGGWDVRLLYIA